ncbi:TPA: DUF6531 domain-containing protein [Pseudomonas aeruginosa]|nr:DUF6531 domain-containing protein [Pseudomonas aeruginosa]
MYKALAFLLLNTFIAVVHAEEGWELSVSGPAPGQPGHVPYPDRRQPSLEAACAASDRYYIDSNLKGGHVVLGYISRKTLIDARYNSFFCSISIFRKSPLAATSGTATYGNPNWWGASGTAVNVTQAPPTGCPYNLFNGRYECPTDVSDRKNAGIPNENGCQGPSSFQGNPINASIGNKFQRETDIDPSHSPLQFERYYNSVTGMWTNTFQEGLKIVGENISLSLPDGRQELFRLTDGAISSDATTGTLSKDQAGWRYDYRDGTSSLFDVQGRLIQRKVRGQVITITYPNLSTTKAKDGFGNTLTVSWNATKQPYLVDYNGSLKVEYLYDGGARLVSKKTTSQGLNRTRKYLYADSGNAGLMVGIIDEQGTRYATWTYDDQGRAISSEHANGAEKVTLAYNDDGSTTVTNEYGKQATYRFQVIQGIKRIVAIEGEPSPNCPGSNSTFTYDDQGLLTSKRDNNGNLTTYQYNARGLETSRTEAAGTAQARTITTDWHPTLFLPVQVSEPGRSTRYQYDAEGRRTSEGIMANQ